MTDRSDEPVGEPVDEPVGSLGEEAAKLFGALSGWARDQQSAEDAPDPTDGTTSGFDAAAHTVAGLTEALRRVDEHVATGAPECRYCPLCRMIHVVRRSSPEVRQQLGDAAVSLLTAAVGLLADRPRETDPGDTPDDTPGGAPGG